MKNPSTFEHSSEKRSSKSEGVKADLPYLVRMYVFERLHNMETIIYYSSKDAIEFSTIMIKKKTKTKTKQRKIMRNESEIENDELICIYNAIQIHVIHMYLHADWPTIILLSTLYLFYLFIWCVCVNIGTICRVRVYERILSLSLHTCILGRCRCVFFSFSTTKKLNYCLYTRFK